MSQDIVDTSRSAGVVHAGWHKTGLPLAGLPIAIKDNVPVEGEPMRCGSTASDPVMPLSVQLVARPGGEALLLGIAHQLEALRPWPRTAPAYA